MSKIFTFSYQYDGDDGFNEISFCAKTREEADELYLQWQEEDHPGKFFPVKNVEVVYDESDADEYGESYGKPEEYQD